MTASEPLVEQYGLDPKWLGPFKSSQKFKGAVYCDPVERALAAARAAVVGPSAEAKAEAQAELAAAEKALLEVEDLVAGDVADWERRAVEDDGVTDPSHVSAHAMIRRTGSACMCPSPNKPGSQFAYPDGLHQGSHELDFALLAAREQLEEARAAA